MNYAEHYRRLYEVDGADAVRCQMSADINEALIYSDGPTVDIEDIVKAAHQFGI